LKLLQGLLPLRRADLRRDALAGVSAASASIPQVLGYATIAGMPVVTGLYTTLLPLLAFALLGSSRRLVVAADSATAAIVSSSLSTLAAPASERYVALVGMLALLTAGMLLLARVFKLGFLADFLSRTVLVGFLTGVGLQVGVAMLGTMVGASGDSHRTPVQVWELARNLPRLDPTTTGLSALVVAGIMLGRRFAPRLPVGLFAVLGATAASVGLDFAARGIAVLGPVVGGLPYLHLPDVPWRDTLALLPVAVSCVAVIVAQSAATSRSFAARHGERVDENADILGLAAANAMAALSGSFVVNGSPSQTALVENAGARSQYAMLALAGVTLLVLLFLAGPLQYLPRCVLASIVFTIALGMVDLKGLADVRRESRGEYWLALATAAAVVAIGVEQGILLAIVLSLLRHLRHSYQPHSAVLVLDAAGHWEPQPALPGVQTAAGLVVYRFGADLFYANADHFVDGVRDLVAHAPQPVRWLVLDASAITAVDYSAARSLRELLDELAQRGVALVFARASPDLRSDLDRHGITALVGAQRVFPTLHEALAAVRSADPHAPAGRINAGFT
jgi:high affinity sulfate transporter 1